MNPWMSCRCMVHRSVRSCLKKSQEQRRAQSLSHPPSLCLSLSLYLPLSHTCTLSLSLPRHPHPLREWLWHSWLWLEDHSDLFQEPLSLTKQSQLPAGLRRVTQTALDSEDHGSPQTSPRVILWMTCTSLAAYQLLKRDVRAGGGLTPDSIMSFGYEYSA